MNFIVIKFTNSERFLIKYIFQNNSTMLMQHKNKGYNTDVMHACMMVYLISVFGSESVVRLNDGTHIKQRIKLFELRKSHCSIVCILGSMSLIIRGSMAYSSSRIISETAQWVCYHSNYGIINCCA